jgi:hypothetical protein
MTLSRRGPGLLRPLFISSIRRLQITLTHSVQDTQDRLLHQAVGQTKCGGNRSDIKIRASSQLRLDFGWAPHASVASVKGPAGSVSVEAKAG